MEKKRGCFSPQLDDKVTDQGDGSKTSHDTKADGKGSVAIEENGIAALDYDRTSDMVSRTDVLCPACKQILFRPAVLNCGHGNI